MKNLRSTNFTLVSTSRRGLRLMTWKHCTRRFMLPFVLILPWQNKPRNLRRRTRGIISGSVETQLALYVMLQLKIKMLSIQ
uniref:Uncharacterized protein n=1 Tax=Triticum urartu TaxID=4572 RepID=A0A8R7QIS4_TRIUA